MDSEDSSLSLGGCVVRTDVLPMSGFYLRSRIVRKCFRVRDFLHYIAHWDILSYFRCIVLACFWNSSVGSDQLKRTSLQSALVLKDVIVRMRSYRTYFLPVREGDIFKASFDVETKIVVAIPVKHFHLLGYSAGAACHHLEGLQYRNSGIFDSNDIPKPVLMLSTWMFPAWGNNRLAS